MRLELASTAALVILHIVVAGCATAVTPSPAMEDPETTLEGRLDAVFEESMRDEHIPGAVLVIVENGRITLSEGYGLADVEAGIPVSPDATVFRIGSITKLLTALAVVQLADQGLINLSDDVNRYLDEIEVPDNYEEAVTFSHILSHTAGFDQIGRDRQSEDPSQRMSLEDFLASNLVRIRPPGRVGCYDTYGMTLAGHLIEEISGVPYGEYMRKNVFLPLGMRNTGVETPVDSRSDLAIGYGFEDGTFTRQPYEIYVTTPASSIDSTAADMARLMIALLGDGSNESGRLLSPQASRQIKQAQFTNRLGFPGFAYGFWEDLRGAHRTIHHGGTMLGISTEMYLVPDLGVGFFLAYNRDPETGPPPMLRSKITDLLLDEWLADGDESPEPGSHPPYPVDTQQYAGSYSHCLYCHTCFEGEGWNPGAISLESGGDGVLLGRNRWLAVNPLVFQEEGGNRRMAFRKDASGRVTHMFIGVEAYERNGEWLLEETFGPDWSQRPPETLTARIYRSEAMSTSTKADWEKAARAYDAVGERRPLNGRNHYYEGFAWLQAREPERALTALGRALELEQWPGWTAYYIAGAHALKGDRENAFEWLERAIESGFDDRALLTSDPLFEDMRDDARFASLLDD